MSHVTKNPLQLILQHLISPIFFRKCKQEKYLPKAPLRQSFFRFRIFFACFPALSASITFIIMVLVGLSWKELSCWGAGQHPLEAHKNRLFGFPMKIIENQNFAVLHRLRSGCNNNKFSTQQSLITTPAVMRLCSFYVLTEQGSFSRKLFFMLNVNRKKYKWPSLHAGPTKKKIAQNCAIP